MTWSNWPSLALATTMMVGFAGVPAVHAQSNQQQAQQQQQQGQPQQRQQQQAPSAEDFNEEELRSYAGAALQVQEINRSFQSQVQSADSSEEQQKLHQQARQEIVSAIENEGLSLEQYNQITMAVQADPDLANQVQGYMRNAQ